MTRTVPLVGVVLLLGAAVAPAQSPPPPPPSPLSYVPPPAMVPPGPTTDPGPAGWGPLDESSARPGLFFTTEIALLFPQVNFGLVNQRPLGSLGETLRVPSADLGTALSPTFEVGYRLPDSAGQFTFGYRYLSADGTGEAVDELGNVYAVRSRLDMQVFDIDYGTAPYEFAPRYEVAARIGVRVANIFFDSQAGNDFVYQQASNTFFGAGPHARLDVERRVVVVPGLSLFGRLDGAVLIGRVRQRYRLERDFGDFLEVSTLRQRSQQSVPALTLQAGLTYSPPALPGFKLAAGYQFEEYFNVGRLAVSGDGTVGSSRGDVWSHGFFLRGQFDF